MNSVRTHARWLVLLSALVAIAALSLPAVVGANSANKQYSAVLLSPNPAPSNAKGFVVRVQFTNNTANQTIGSAQLVLPAGFTVTGASDEGCTSSTAGCNTPSINGNTVTYSNLNNGNGIPTNGGQETLDVTVNTPSSCGGSYPVTVHAHQANAFNSQVGNVFSPDPTTVAMTVGGCYTAMISPTAVTASTSATYVLTITNASPMGSPFTINSATIAVPFTVTQVVPPSGWTASGTQTVTLSTSTAAPLGPGDSVSVQITATAPTVTGTYTWTTTASDSGTPATLSGSQPSVQVANSVVTCPAGQPCNSGPITTNNSGPETMAQVDANTGPQADTLTTDLPDPTVVNGLPISMCPGQDQTHFGQIVFWSVPTRSTVIVYTVAAVAHYRYDTGDTCFGQATEFTTANGTPAQFNSANNEFEGTIPMCSSKNPVPPCVASIQADEFGFAFGETGTHTVTFTIDAPDGRYQG
jgi:hypothetical protein